MEMGRVVVPVTEGRAGEDMMPSLIQALRGVVVLRSKPVIDIRSFLFFLCPGGTVKPPKAPGTEVDKNRFQWVPVRQTGPAQAAHSGAEREPDSESR